MMDRLAAQHVVLLGIGHTNAHVLRMWRMHAPADADLTCISDNPIATYSGMLPAVLAGQIPPSQMEIDLVRLCESVGARLITDRVTGLDRDARQLCFDGRPPVPFDVLSIGIGSRADVHGLSVEGESLVEIKPMQSFLARLESAVMRALEVRVGDPLRVVVVGSGVAGIEITCCLPTFLSRITDRPIAMQLVTSSDQILPGVEASTRAKVAAELRRRGVTIKTGEPVDRVCRDSIRFAGGGRMDAGVVVWATNATAPNLLGELGLDLDDRGFIATDHTLQSTSAERIFAVGDTGTIIGEGLPKAGVYAVRQGPVLWENILRTLTGRPLARYRPQRSFLKLINLGDGRAVGQWKSFSFQGRWVMRLKDRIDTRFMDLFDVDAMSASDMAGDDEMQCRGCGCKLGSSVLELALNSQDDVTLDDAAPIGGPLGKPLIASTDFFSSPMQDAFLAGRIAALHSASDIIATGATATEALANLVVPEGDPETQRRLVHDFLAGARLEFDAMGASIVGGHTIVGPRMEVGFTVVGRPIGSSLIRKANLRGSDRLFITKPLGIGVLLAAHMRSACAASHYMRLIATMLERQHLFAAIAVENGIDAGTDVTGFGLAGHLGEMVTASGVSAEIWLDEIPILPGVAELIDRGIQSTLAPDNRSASQLLDAELSIQERPEYAAIFDPQTCGGLLLAVDEANCDRFVDATNNAGLSARQIGRVHAANGASKPIKVVAFRD